MNICVFGASSNQISSIYIESAFTLGKLIGKEGHTLIFGGGDNGVMGSVARGVKSQGGTVIGVIPEFINADGITYPDCDKVIATSTMHARKEQMETLSDAFIVCPGGIGTFEEFFEVLSLKQLQRHEKAILILNTAGYYDSILHLMEKSIQEEFVKDVCRELYQFVDTAEEAMQALHTYQSRYQNGNVFKGIPTRYTFDSVKENE